MSSENDMWRSRAPSHLQVCHIAAAVACHAKPAAVRRPAQPACVVPPPVAVGRAVQVHESEALLVVVSGSTNAVGWETWPAEMRSAAVRCNDGGQGKEGDEDASHDLTNEERLID